MKNVIFLLFVGLCAQDIYCNDFLLKFHQNVYKIKDLRTEVMSFNEKYFRVFEIKTYKFNRTTPAINLTMNFKITVKDQLEVFIQGYKFMSNEYRHFPIRFQVNLKKAADSNAIGLNTIKNCGNIKSFSFEKDITYFLCNYIVDATRFPPLVPNGRYKFDIKYLYLNEEAAFTCGYGEIYTPIEYPKK